MTADTAARRRALRNVLSSQQLSSQHEIMDALLGTGYEVTQATVSRDLEAIGAVKRRGNGGASYVVEDDRYPDSYDLRSSSRAIADFVE